MSRQNNRYSLDQTCMPTFAKEAVATPVPVTTLLDILRRPRFSETPGEAYVIEKYILPLGAEQDGYGNFWLVVGDEKPTTMFSSHTDTVHKKTATDTYKLSIKGAWLTVAGGGVLGADCGTGIWIMLNMIEAKVPGLYVFHRDEEIGGGGSLFIAKHCAKELEGIKHCIAFDRKDTSHIITHQGGSRCCSDEFAQVFADLLNVVPEFRFHGDDTGSFTDSANYTEIIPECTNLSIGYYDQHTQQECQDLSFVTRLVNQLIAIDYTLLPAKRDPAEVEVDDWNWYRPRKSSMQDHGFMTTLVEKYPAEIADMMQAAGWDSDGLLEELEHTYGCDLNDILWSLTAGGHA